VSERAGEVECTGEEERESDLNVVGSKMVETSSIGRPVAPTGLARLTGKVWKSFCLAICRVS
jgi:hypothetical protein